MSKYDFYFISLTQHTNICTLPIMMDVLFVIFRITFVAEMKIIFIFHVRVEGLPNAGLGYYITYTSKHRIRMESHND